MLFFHDRLKMCGIFAYLNYLTPKTREEVLKTLINGLHRLEYRGYDSAGVGIDGPNSKDIILLKKQGQVSNLEDEIEDGKFKAVRLFN